MNGRVYDPLVARFLSADPIALVGSGQGANSYAYVLGNPLSLTDPSGFSPADGDPPALSRGADVWIYPPRFLQLLRQEFRDAIADYREWRGIGVQQQPPQLPQPPKPPPQRSSRPEDQGSFHPVAPGENGGGIAASETSNAEPSPQGNPNYPQPIMNPTVCANLAAHDANAAATIAGFTAAGFEFGPWGALTGFAVGIGVDLLSGGFDKNSPQSSAVEGLGSVAGSGGQPGSFFGTQAQNAFRGAFPESPGIGIVGGAVFGNVVSNAIVGGAAGTARAAKFGALAGAAYLGTYAAVYNYVYGNCMGQ
jgi:hypothetical protein